MASQNSSSKTVAAILKQHQDLVAAREMSASQQQLAQSQQQRRKGKTKQVHKPQAQIINHLTTAVINMTNQTPQQTLSVPQMFNHTVAGGDGVIINELKPTNTTKASSLSRELSPSRITAQMKKVMPDPSTHPNLLLSALQGNMPDPITIFNPSKAENVMISQSELQQNSTTDGWQTPVNNQPIDSQFSNSVVNNAFNPVTILSQLDSSSTTDSMSSLSPNLTTVESLLALSGNIQTINVSHVPKTAIPSSSNNIGQVSDGASSSGMSSSSHSVPRSAMEVAQQIRMEANGQCATAQRNQNQLLTQIKGSRSIDAQLTIQQNSSPTVLKGHEKQKPVRVDTNQKVEYLFSDQLVQILSVYFL